MQEIRVGGILERERQKEKVEREQPSLISCRVTVRNSDQPSTTLGRKEEGREERREGRQEGKRRKKGRKVERKE